MASAVATASSVFTQNFRFPLPLQLRRGGLPDARTRGIAAVSPGREVPAPPGVRQRGTAGAAQEQKRAGRHQLGAAWSRQGCGGRGHHSSLKIKAQLSQHGPCTHSLM